MTSSKRIDLCLFLIIFFSSISFSQEQLPDLKTLDYHSILNEQFEDNSAGWIYDTQYLNVSFSNGEIVLTCKNYNESTGIIRRLTDLDYNRDFKIECDIKIIKGSGGLIFGMSEDFAHHRIEINSKGNVFVIKDNPVSRKTEILYSESYKKQINLKESNRLVLIRKEGKYFLFINSVFITSLNGISPVGSYVGFNSDLNSQTGVGFLNISYLSQIPIKSETLSLKSESNSGLPVIRWTSPSSDTTVVDIISATIKATVNSASPITKALFYVNGNSIGEGTIVPENNAYRIEKLIEFKSGKNIVYFNVTNLDGLSKNSEARYFINPRISKPLISWNKPSGGESVFIKEEKITLELCIKSATALTLVDVLVNGDSRGKDRIFERLSVSGCDYIFKRTIDLKEGTENVVKIIAENEAGTTDSEPIKVIYNKTLADKKIALVIGNSEYKNIAGLKNTVNDANLMQATLENLGFNVIKRTDLILDSLESELSRFSRLMRNYNVALFYYAGHGVQVDGVNYLVPVDAKMAQKEDCSLEAYSLSRMTDEFAKYPSNINIVILDACRSFSYGWSRGQESGILTMNSTNGIITGYATSPGSSAADGTGENGLYTEELVNQMNIHQTIEEVFKNTRVKVMERTKGQQRPQYLNELNGNFYFK